MAVCPWLSTLSSLPVSFSLSQTFHFTVGDISFHSQHHFISLQCMKFLTEQDTHWPFWNWQGYLHAPKQVQSYDTAWLPVGSFSKSEFLKRSLPWSHLPWLPKLDLSLHYGYTPSRISSPLKFLNRLVGIGHLEIKNQQIFSEHFQHGLRVTLGVHDLCVL